MANVQLDQVVVMWRIGDRECAALAVLEQEFDVLAGQKLQPLGLRQLQFQFHDVVRQQFHRFDAAGQGLDFHVTTGADFTHHDAEVAFGTGLAEHRLALLLLFQSQANQFPAVTDLARYELTGAFTAGTIAAAVRQTDALAQCGLEHGFPVFDFEFMTAGGHGDLETHVRLVLVNLPHIFTQSISHRNNHVDGSIPI